MKSRLLIALLIAVVGVLASQDFTAKAQTIPYNYEFNATNLYTDDIIFYEFSGLDVSRSYSWGIWTVDEQTGNLKDRIWTKVIGPGVAAGNWVFGAGILADGRWPEDYIGPINVVDNFGFTLHKHYVHPPIWPDGDRTVTQEWESSLGAFNFQSKQVFGNKIVAPNTCQSVVFEPLNVNGHHYNFNPCQVTTTVGDYAILHFQFDPVGYASPTNDQITVYAIDEGSATPAMVLDLDNLDTFQHTSGSTGAPTFTAFDSFIIINTGPNELPFINYERADFAFGFDGFNNPMRWGDNGGPVTLNEIEGVYGCARFDNVPVVVADCEAPWIVSSDPTVTTSGSTEWSLTASLGEIGEAGQQSLVHRQFTQAVWDAYSGSMQTFENYSGLLDTALYAYTPERTTKYTVNNTANPAVVAQWELIPRVVPFVAVDVIPSDYRVITGDSFAIEIDVTFEENIDQVINNVGLDTELGRTMLHGLIIFFSMAVVAAMPFARTNILAYLIAWTFAGGIWAVAGFSSDFGTLIFSIATIMLWVLSFTMFRDALNSDRESDDA